MLEHVANTFEPSLFKNAAVLLCLSISISAGVRVFTVGQDVLIELQAHRQCCQIGSDFPPNMAILAAIWQHGSQVNCSPLRRPHDFSTGPQHLCGIYLEFTFSAVQIYL